MPPVAIEGKTVAQLTDWIFRVEGRGPDFATDGVELLNAISGFDLEKSDGRYLLRRKRFN